jgi:Flp pilus assembly protein TadG
MTRLRRALRDRRARGQRGAAAVEFALVLLPLLYLVFGLIQYGWYFYAMQAGSSAVGNAARQVAVGNCQNVGQVQTMLKKSLGGATTATSASQIPTTLTYTKADGSAATAPGAVGGSITVKATFPTFDLHFPLVPVPNNGNVSRTAVARVEDITAQGACQ